MSIRYCMSLIEWQLIHTLNDRKCHCDPCSVFLNDTHKTEIKYLQKLINYFLFHWLYMNYYDLSLLADNFGKLYRILLVSPLPQGPLAVGVWEGRNACPSAHTVRGWSCSPGRGNLRLGPGVSPRLFGSCGCGTRSPCGAAPHLEPQELDGVEGWATGPPGSGRRPLQPEHLQLRCMY